MAKTKITAMAGNAREPHKLPRVSAWTLRDVVCACPICAAYAVVPLSPALLAEQPDDTTHVCHPGFGGCNQGFAIDQGHTGAAAWPTKGRCNVIEARTPKQREWLARYLERTRGFEIHAIANGDEGSFSWSACDTCGCALGGLRFRAVLTNPGSRADEIDVRSCVDCVHFAANGTLPEEG